MTTPNCWRPGCRHDPAHRLDAGWYHVRSCDRDLAVARSVTGIGLVARARRDGGDVLFEMDGAR